jgi:catechol 2,3-dioxygenase-like lactoylglutathione lyase family enzyme
VTPSAPRVHHVGIVVSSVERAEAMLELLGLSESFRGFVPAYNATCIFTEGNGGSQIELVVPAGGKLAEFNRGFGGLHHVALSVPSLRDLAEEFSGRGIPLLEKEPVRGAGDFLCNFLAPAHTRGVLVEFVEELP